MALQVKSHIRKMSRTSRFFNKKIKKMFSCAKIFFQNKSLWSSYPLMPKQNFRNAPNKNYIELPSKKSSKCQIHHIKNHPNVLGRSFCPGFDKYGALQCNFADCIGFRLHIAVCGVRLKPFPKRVALCFAGKGKFYSL